MSESEKPGEAAPVKAGDLIAGKWRVERVLGTGGMGVVVAARHVQLDQRVAIKLLLPSAVRDREVIARFEREARAAAKLAGQHVARVLDVGVLEDGAPYMVMEYLEGRDLARVVHDQGPLPVREAVDYVIEACDALAEAHAVGIVHRDVKPANMFLARQPDGSDRVKVIDFGISKIEGSDAGLTGTTAVLGSPLYMSPEQLAATRTADARSDVWSLGVTLYELLTGATPFRGETIAHLVTAVLHREPPPPSAARTEVSRELDAVVMKCLTKEPKGRYSSVAALASALAPFGGEGATAMASRVTRITETLGETLREVVLPSDSLPAGSRTVDRTPSPGSTTSRSRSRVRVLAVLAVAVVILTGGSLALRRAQTSAAIESDAAATPASVVVIPSSEPLAPADAATARELDAAPPPKPRATSPERRNPLRPQLK